MALFKSEQKDLPFFISFTFLSNVEFLGYYPQIKVSRPIAHFIAIPCFLTWQWNALSVSPLFGLKWQMQYLVAGGRNSTLTGVLECCEKEFKQIILGHLILD